VQFEHKRKGYSYLAVIGVIFAIATVLIAVWFFIPKERVNKVLNPFGKNKDTQIVKNIPNPLTGILHTEEESGFWLNKRPIGAMVNNHTDARPQSGLIHADIVYEMVAEGGITRYLAFFLTQDPLKAGPIRSIREYYLVLVKELGDAMIMHIGWSPQALVAIESWPVRSLNRLGLNCENVLPDPTDLDCWRNKSRVDNDIPWEHTAYANISQLRKKGEEAGWQGYDETFVVWSFKDDVSKYGTYPSASEIYIDFWYEGDYSAIFKYNASDNSYLRYLGYDQNGQPQPHRDAETGEQIKIGNVIVQFATETAISGDDKNRLDYELEGSGEAYIFMDGKKIDATWNKSSRAGRTLFYDMNGAPIQFNRGKFWISIVPDRNKTQVEIY